MNFCRLISPHSHRANKKENPRKNELFFREKNKIPAAKLIKAFQMI